jgi:elongator complex protein 3
LVDRIKPDIDCVQIQTQKYEASEGKEIFLSAEDPIKDVLVGYLRLRIQSEKARRPEIATEPCSIIRELHVYGPLVPVGKRLAKAWQHKGFGSLLLSEAERVSKEAYNCRKIVVTSALGTRQYYKRFAYSYDGPYMSKVL